MARQIRAWPFRFLANALLNVFRADYWRDEMNRLRAGLNRVEDNADPALSQFSGSISNATLTHPRASMRRTLLVPSAILPWTGSPGAPRGGFIRNRAAIVPLWMIRFQRDAIVRSVEWTGDPESILSSAGGREIEAAVYLRAYRVRSTRIAADATSAYFTLNYAHLALPEATAILPDDGTVSKPRDGIEEVGVPVQLTTMRNVAAPIRTDRATAMELSIASWAAGDRLLFAVEYPYMPQDAAAIPDITTTTVFGSLSVEYDYEFPA